MRGIEQDEFFNDSGRKKEGTNDQNPSENNRKIPLAARMRPKSLAEIVGQDHILGENALLPRLVKENQFGSLLFYGPPGCGKTSMAEAISLETGSRFLRLNAVVSNTAELRDVLKLARSYPEQTPILFIDEIHRFNKAQQDLLLPDVEAGNVRLIGATTHNPGFYVNPPLLSRSHLFRLEPVSETAIFSALKRALSDNDIGLGSRDLEANDASLISISKMADGDLRRALNALETICMGTPIGTQVTESTIAQYAKERQIRYDRDADDHYDTASAFIKSMRGGDPDAALYWLAKMLEGGEDPRFIVRRMIIFASEDVGLADPRALPMATACLQACDFIGLPECGLNLAHVVVFLATCPKSNSTTVALGKATSSIRNEGMDPVPIWLKDGHTKFNKSQGQSVDYEYSHNFPEAISGQKYMLKDRQFYVAKESGAEARIAERLAHWKKLRKKQSD